MDHDDPIDEERARRLLSFGEDYRNYLDSLSEGGPPSIDGQGLDRGSIDGHGGGEVESEAAATKPRARVRKNKKVCTIVKLSHTKLGNN